MLEPGGNSRSKLAPKVGANVGQAVYASGSAYSLSNTAALVHLGTADPSIILNGPGTYLLLARLRLDYNGATFAAVRTVAAKLRRVSGSAADLTNASAGLKTAVITALTYTAGDINIPPIIYQTDQPADNIQIFASIDTVPTQGTIDVVEAEIIAIKLS